MTPDWLVAATSVAGTSHHVTATPCQDSHLAEIVECSDPTLMLIASDGAGSAACAEAGAYRACRELADCLRLFLLDGGRLAEVTHELAAQWLESVGEAIGCLAAEEGRSVRDYACTLLAAFVSAEHAVMLQVGDGAIVFRPRGDDGWCLMTWPQHGEYINTTVFVTDPRARANFEFCAHTHVIEEIAVFTDGIEGLVLHFATQTIHGAFFDAMFPALRQSTRRGVDRPLSEQLAQYLSAPAICARTDDDKTLLLASRLTEPVTAIFGALED